MATKEEIFAEAQALGIATTPDMHHFAVAALIKKHKEGNTSAGPTTTAAPTGLAPVDPTPTPEPTPEPTPTPTPDPVPNPETKQEPEPTPAPAPRQHAAPTVPFDINKLTPEQLKQLKAALEETPSIASNSRMTVTVRRFNEKIVIGVKNASSKSVLDPIEQKPVTKITIPVLYHGAKDFVTEDYKEFMTSERVKCEVVSQREVKDRIVEGVVYSMEMKKDVEQVVNTVVRFYTIKLPNGETIELFEDAVNL